MSSSYQCRRGQKSSRRCLARDAAFPRCACLRCEYTNASSRKRFRRGDFSIGRRFRREWLEGRVSNQARFLVVVPRAKVVGSIGSIASKLHKRLPRTLGDYLIQ